MDRHILLGGMTICVPGETGDLKLFITYMLLQ